MKESIETFGNNDPIAIDEDNVIIEGHGRYIALKELAYEKVPVVRLMHLSKKQKRAYVLAHNKITLNTGFDMERIDRYHGY
nr:ParB/Srx family N-terminal domain-containing protein [Streptococcus pluranimalium]